MAMSEKLGFEPGSGLEKLPGMTKRSSLKVFKTSPEIIRPGGDAA